MNRYYLFSLLLHSTIFSIVGISTRSSFKKIPQIEVYKVSFAPLPQPKVASKPLPLEEKTKPQKEKKRPPENKKKEIKQETTSKTTKGLPDITPRIYTGSGRGFTYSYYLNILLNKIAGNWNNPYREKDVILKSIVYFEVDKDGVISNIRLEYDSGDNLYNESTIRAVSLTKKLPPLPEEFSEDYLKVHLEFLTGK
ncbi:MAG: TonB C-terminal domain-containing protein [candidate division WOR-3 bacterium]